MLKRPQLSGVTHALVNKLDLKKKSFEYRMYATGGLTYYMSITLLLGTNSHNQLTIICITYAVGTKKDKAKWECRYLKKGRTYNSGCCNGPGPMSALLANGKDLRCSLQ
jgi:hypothetical protein